MFSRISFLCRSRDQGGSDVATSKFRLISADRGQMSRDVVHCWSSLAESHQRLPDTHQSWSKLVELGPNLVKIHLGLANCDQTRPKLVNFGQTSGRNLPNVRHDWPTKGHIWSESSGIKSKFGQPRSSLFEVEPIVGHILPRSAKHVSARTCRPRYVMG